MPFRTLQEKLRHDAEFQKSLEAYQTHFDDEGFRIDPVLMIGYQSTKNRRRITIRSLPFQIKQWLGLDKPFKI